MHSDCYRTICHKIVKNHCFKGRKLRPNLSNCFFFSFMKPISSSNFLYASETVLFIFKSVDMITAHA